MQEHLARPPQLGRTLLHTALAPAAGSIVRGMQIGGGLSLEIEQRAVCEESPHADGDGGDGDALSLRIKHP